MGEPLPKVSVIIPAYNHARWIKQALASVFQQTLRDWELIIIDDASSDRTWDEIQSYLSHATAASHHKITAIQHHTNQGAPATLNEGLSLANGEYIAILNSDDVWHEERLARLYEYAAQASCDFVATGIQLWDKDSRLKNASEPDWLAWYQSLQLNWRKNKDFLQTLLLGNFLITTSNFFFQRALYQRLGGFAGLRYVHDYEYALRLYQEGANMTCLWDEPLLNYRLHGDNTIRELPLVALQENMHMLLGQLPHLYRSLNSARLQSLSTQLGEIFKYYGEEWQTEVHHNLVAKEEELFTLIEDRDRWVAERDDIIIEQLDSLQMREHWIAERDGWVAERDALISRLQADIALQQAWIKEREQWLSDRDDMIGKRDHWVAERDSWIAERDAWILERDQLIASLKLEYDQALSSRAYRLGRLLLSPLRLLRDRINPRSWKHGHA